MRCRPFHAMLLVGVAVMLSGCAGPMGTMRSGPSMPAAAVAATSEQVGAVTTYDGIYRGKLRVTGSFGSGKDTANWCDSPGQPTITVANGQFSYAVPHPNVPGNTSPAFPAVVTADGSFYGEIVAGTISGRITGNHMEGKIDGSACLYAFSADRA